MIYRDYLADLGLRGTSGEGISNVILSYLIDNSSQLIQATDILTFVDNKVRKMGVGDIPHCIALESGVAGDVIKCQVVGIVKLKDKFIPGVNYFVSNGGLVGGEGDVHIGLGITKDELLLKRGVFIHV